jgi:hypothetical protein
MTDVTETAVPTKPESKPELPKVVEKKPEPTPSDNKIISPVVVESKPTPVTKKELRFKLNLYTSGGTIRPIFNGSVMRDISRKFGDIIRSLSSTKFMTEDEVCESVWAIEKKMRYPTHRTRPQIKSAVQELIDRQIIVTD